MTFNNNEVSETRMLLIYYKSPFLMYIIVFVNVLKRFPLETLAKIKRNKVLLYLINDSFSF